jgi:hypothetical protein
MITPKVPLSALSFSMYHSPPTLFSEFIVLIMHIVKSKKSKHFN